MELHRLGHQSVRARALAGAPRFLCVVVVGTHPTQFLSVDRGYNDLFDVVVELNGDVIYDIGTLKSQEIFFENGTVPTNASEINMVFKARATGNLGRTVVVDSSNPCTSPVPASDNGLTPGTSLPLPRIFF